MPEQVWRCKKCKDIFSSEEDAVECEKNHVDFSGGKGLPEQEYLAQNPYPSYLKFRVLRKGQKKFEEIIYKAWSLRTIKH